MNESCAANKGAYHAHAHARTRLAAVSSEVHLLREQLNDTTRALKDMKKEKETIEGKAAKLVSASEVSFDHTVASTCNGMLTKKSEKLSV